MAPGNTDPSATKKEESTIFKALDGKFIEIRDVWASNLDKEMSKIVELLEKYNYVAMVINTHSASTNRITNFVSK